MTRRRAEDYDAIFRKLEELLPAPRGMAIVSDFEISLWKSVKRCLPQVKHHECGFHWAQAIMKKLCDKGKYIVYCNGGPVKDTVSQIFCLPYLPA